MTSSFGGSLTNSFCNVLQNWPLWNPQERLPQISQGRVSLRAVEAQSEEEWYGKPARSPYLPQGRAAHTSTATLLDHPERRREMPTSTPHANVQRSPTAWEMIPKHFPISREDCLPGQLKLPIPQPGQKPDWETWRQNGSPRKSLKLFTNHFLETEEVILWLQSHIHRKDLQVKICQLVRPTLKTNYRAQEGHTRSQRRRISHKSNGDRTVSNSQDQTGKVWFNTKDLTVTTQSSSKDTGMQRKYPCRIFKYIKGIE